MSPYRTLGERVVLKKNSRTIKGKLTSLKRKFQIFWGGSFLSRQSRCPFCLKYHQRVVNHQQWYLLSIFEDLCCSHGKYVHQNYDWEIVYSRS